MKEQFKGSLRYGNGPVVIRLYGRTLRCPLIVNVPLIVILLVHTQFFIESHRVFLEYSFMPCASIYDFTSFLYESRNDLGGREYTEHHNIHSHDQIFLLTLSKKHSGVPETHPNATYQLLKRSANMWAM